MTAKVTFFIYNHTFLLLSQKPPALGVGKTSPGGHAGALFDGDIVCRMIFM